MDIHLADGIGDAEYLDRLENGLKAAFTIFHPELVVYVAGADPYCEDQLGGLSLTFEGLANRDRMVIGRPSSGACRWPSCWPADMPPTWPIPWRFRPIPPKSPGKSSRRRLDAAAPQSQGFYARHFLNFAN